MVARAKLVEKFEEQRIDNDISFDDIYNQAKISQDKYMNFINGSLWYLHNKKFDSLLKLFKFSDLGEVIKLALESESLMEPELFRVNKYDKIINAPKVMFLQKNRQKNIINYMHELMEYKYICNGNKKCLMVNLVVLILMKLYLENDEFCSVEERRVSLLNEIEYYEDNLYKNEILARRFLDISDLSDEEFEKSASPSKYLDYFRAKNRVKKSDLSRLCGYSYTYLRSVFNYYKQGKYENAGVGFFATCAIYVGAPVSLLFTGYFLYHQKCDFDKVQDSISLEEVKADIKKTATSWNYYKKRYETDDVYLLFSKNVK